MYWLAAVSLLLVALLFVPFSAEFELRRQGQLEVQVKPRWGPLPLPVPSSTTNEKDAEAGRREAKSPGKRRRKKRGKRGGRSPSVRQLRALVFSDGFVSSLIRLAKRYIWTLRPRDVSLHVKLGMGSPVDTGRLCGALAPLVAVLGALEVESMSFEPDFARRNFEMDARGRVQVVPGVLIALTLGYLVSPPPWRALRRFVTA